MSDGSLALWVKNTRRRAGFATQADLADAMGVRRSAVANWETGRAKMSMAHAERFAVVTRRERAEVLSRFGYPIGGGAPIPTPTPEIPQEWLAMITRAVAAGVADGVAQALDELRREGLLEGPVRGPGGSRSRQSA
jgi:DNA-binding XRE family transcriptional regulator